MKHTKFAAASVALLATLASTSSYAQLSPQAWPVKPIKLIAPFPPGGGADTVGRPLAKVLSERLGQPVIIENRSGAAGTVGGEVAAKSAPDGYTFLIGSLHHVIAHVLYPKLAYDITKDLVPVTTVALMPNVVVVHPQKVPVGTFEEFFRRLKANPGKLNYASGGSGTTQHVTVELFKLQTQTFAVHVPYRGAGPAVQDLIAGQVDFMFNVLAPTIPHIRAGKLNALAVTSSKRSLALPEVPTLAELGIQGVDVSTWFGIFAPAGTPREIVERMQREIVGALSGTELQQTWQLLGMEPGGISSNDMGKLVAADIRRWGKVVKEAGIKVE